MDEMNGNKTEVNGINQENENENVTNINDLFIKESDGFESDSEKSNGNKNINFSSSDSESYSKTRNRSKTIRKTHDKIKKKSIGINATTGSNLISNIPNNKSNSNSSDSDNLTNSINSQKPESPDKPPSDDPTHKNTTSMVEHMFKPNNINGWDAEANVTIKNWYHTFKQQSFIYQWILDNNNLISERLAIASIITSSTLGIFSGFKLWIPDGVFQTTSNVILVLCNFCVALITAMSRRYGGDKRTDSIREYIHDVDEFLGEISAQVLKSPIYRMDADEFFRKNNDKYTKLISNAPNMTIDEINKAKKLYQIYIQQIDTLPV